MKAVVVAKNGVEILDVEIPIPKKNEVLIKVFSCGLNRADLMVADGGAHGSSGGSGTIVGMEFSGEIIEFGSEVNGFSIGDRVMCSGTSAWAEYAITDWGRVIKIPDNNMDFDVACTLPIALATMHNAIITAGDFKKGQSILIQGASSGVGLMGLQIGKYKGAKIVIGSSTKIEKHNRLKEIGADVVVDSKNSEWVNQVLNHTDGEGVDLIIDQLSGYTVNQNMLATKIKGNIVNVGRLAGGITDFNCDLHALRRINYKGVTFRTRSLDEIRNVYSNMWNDFKNLILEGNFSLPIDKTFEFEDVEYALTCMRENKHFGKLILKL
ncbi:zinc-binding dehydrogenase [Alphaproteobacteria bacterium]|jgi:NADPH2:quinone reductase|nr:zinc-binding dehydrogenase [Alphaproteobacteria bacterium]|tara:strand:- start:7599 stop:8570 length:972 start_codon:yes stop_codon:yes gene_type:complete